MAQCANDTSITVEGEEKMVENLVNLLNIPSSSSGLDINWSGSIAYWQSPF